MNYNYLTISNYSITDLRKDIILVQVKKLEIKSNSVLAVIGEIGSGKSLLFKGIVRLLDAKLCPHLLIQGNIECSRQIFRPGKESDASIINLLRLKSAGLSYFRREVQMIFQEPERALNPSISVLTALKEALKLIKYKKNGKELKNYLTKQLFEFGLNTKDFINRKVGLLSGGEKRRLMVLRTLLMNPKIIIADEPLSELDKPNRQIILTKFIEYIKQGGTLIFISHDIPEILDFNEIAELEPFSKYIALMKKGKLINPIKNEGRMLLGNNTLSDDYRDFFSSVNRRWPNYNREEL